MRASLRDLLFVEDKLYPPRLGNLAAWYDLSLPASTTSDDIRIDSSNRVRLIADKSGNSAVNCLCLNGVAGNYASAPDSNALDITSDIDIRVDCAAVDWTPSESHALVSKYGYSENQRSYYFYLNTAGALVFRVAVVGTVLSLEIASGTATGIADLARSWVRVTYDQNSGAGQYAIAFWKSPDGAAWTQIGTTKTGASVAATFTGTAPVLVGSVGSLATNAEQFNGRIYRAIIKSGIDGTTVFDADFTAQAKLVTSFTESSANAATVTINATGDLGARIAGERDLYQATASKQPVLLPFTGTKYGYLNGVAGNYCSTPDSAALDITGDIDLRVECALTDWTPSVSVGLLSKWNAVPQLSYRLLVEAAAPSGRLAFIWTEDGSTQKLEYSTAALTLADRERSWVRATMDVDNGAGAYEVRFYFSADGVVWTQLGSTVTGGATTSIYAGTQGVEIGSRSNGTATLATGNFYRAQIYDGIDGTLVFDFNPAAYVSGTTFLDSSSNGATITLNGGATIVDRTQIYTDGTNDYMKAPAFALSQPETVYLVGKQVTWTDLDTFFDGNGNTASAMSFRQRTSSPGLEFLGSGLTLTLSPALSLQTNGVLVGVLNATASSVRLNRNALVTGELSPQGADGFTLGCRSNTTTAVDRFANITVSEILIRSGSPDTTGMQDRIIRYAGRKWLQAV